MVGTKSFHGRKCTECTYYFEEHEGEYGGWLADYGCEKKGQEHYSNLKSFPFKNKQPCFIPEFWLSEYSEEFGKDSDLIDPNGCEFSLDNSKTFQKWKAKYFPKEL